MNERLRLCEHLADGATLEVPDDWILDWSDGPVRAVGRCARCGSLALLERVEGRERRDGSRVFAAAAVERPALELLLRDLARGSCDGSRADAERHAFLASAGPFEAHVELDGETGHWRGCAERSA